MQPVSRIAGLLNLGRWLPLATARPGKSAQLAPGVYLTRSLRLSRPLSASGRVWVAEHAGLKLEVVVKFLGAARVPVEGDAQRDGVAAAALKDPHIVQTLDHGGARAGLPFVVMELLAGESLRARVQRTGPLALREVRTIVGQTAGALGKVHASGIAHGQITLDNLFLTDAAGEPFIKILGFKHPPEVRRPGVMPEPTLSPDPRYASPEQLSRHAPSDPQSDLWGLAVAIYELLTRSAPFSAATPEALATAVCHGPLVPVTRYRPDLPHAMDAWFARALSKDRAHRYRTASGFAQSFAEAADGHYFVDPDRGAQPDDDDDQDEPTALWTQPAWWMEEAAAAEARPMTFGSSSSTSPSFASSRRAPTMAIRIPHAMLSSRAPVQMPTAPPPSARPLLFPLFAIAVGTMVGLTGALLVWGSEFLPQRARSSLEVEAEGALRTGADTALAPLAQGGERGIGTDRVRSSALQPNEPSAAAEPTEDDAIVLAPSEPSAVILASEPRQRVAPARSDPARSDPARDEPRRVAPARPAPRASSSNGAGVRSAASNAASRPREASRAAAPAQKSGAQKGSAPARRGKGGECDPPYYFDEQHIKRVKFQCL